MDKNKKLLFSTGQVDDSMYSSSDLHVVESIKGDGAIEIVHETQRGDERIILYRDGVIALNEFLTKWLSETGGK